jgi:hypothetical protein
MKTLDEVIKANEYCDHGEPDSRCEDCPYNGIGACCAERETDALHYLKELKEARNIIATAREEAKKQIEDFKADVEYRMAYNPALTWDELRTMEGKPVWIDSVPLVRRWVIIKKFHPIGGNHNLFDMEVEDGAHFLRKSMGRYTGAWWQAYRKER